MGGGQFSCSAGNFMPLSQGVHHVLRSAGDGPRQADRAGRSRPDRRQAAQHWRSSQPRDSGHSLTQSCRYMFFLLVRLRKK